MSSTPTPQETVTAVALPALGLVILSIVAFANGYITSGVVLLVAGIVLGIIGEIALRCCDE